MNCICPKIIRNNRMIFYSVNALLYFTYFDLSHAFNTKSSSPSPNINAQNKHNQNVLPQIILPTSLSQFEQYVPMSRNIIKNLGMKESSAGLRSLFTENKILFKNKINKSSSTFPEEYVIPKESYFVLIMLFFVSALCSLDRVAMSVAIIPMTSQFNYSEQVKGLISTMFSFGYLFGIIPAGIH